MILWLASYPRSGNTFLRILLRDCFGVETYSDSNDSLDIGSSEAFASIVGHRHYKGDWDDFYAKAKSAEELIPIKTHDGPRDGEKAIYLVRDPRAASVSYFHYYEKFGRMAMSMEDIIVGATPPGPWCEHVRSWRPAERANTLLLRFEDMKSSPESAIKAIADFIGKQPLRTSLAPFDKLQSSRPDFFRTGSNQKNLDELSGAQKALISMVNADVMREFDYAPDATDGALELLRLYSRQVLEGKKQTLAGNIRAENLEKWLMESRETLNGVREDLEMARANRRIAREELRIERKALLAEQEMGRLRLESQRDEYESELSALRDEARALTTEKAHLEKRVTQTEIALAPSLSSIFSLRALRFVFSEWRRIKAGGEHWRPLTPAEPSRHGAAERHPQEVLKLDPVAQAVADAEARGASATSCGVSNLGIAVFGFDRADCLAHVLHALTLQGAAPFTHVFIDGDQGRPAKRADIDMVHECARQFPVKTIHRNHGNFGFRKMMLLSMKSMMDRYEKIIFLEDDCFPVGGAVEDFDRELDAVADKPDICSIYGHHFLVPGEENGLARFQGWGWATTAAKLRPVWDELMKLYLMPEEEYLSFVERELTPEIARRIDVTPGRQPTDTIRKFFAWDEALCLVTALRGMRHQASSRRLVYNFGAGGKSSHFHAVDFYRKRPFNMVGADEIWDYY